MDIREFINLVAAGNTEYDRLQEIARDLQSATPTVPAPNRTLRVWTLACDDNRNGTYASVHLTERAAWAEPSPSCHEREGHDDPRDGGNVHRGRRVRRAA